VFPAAPLADDRALVTSDLGALLSLWQLRTRPRPCRDVCVDQVAPEVEPAVIDGHQAIEVPVQGLPPARRCAASSPDRYPRVHRGPQIRGAHSLRSERRLRHAGGHLPADRSRASGLVRPDTLVTTKTPKIVRQDYQVSYADMRHCQAVYPMVREAMRFGVYLPNRGSNLSSRRYCNFCGALRGAVGRAGEWGGRGVNRLIGRLGRARFAHRIGARHPRLAAT
jgi:hypothetical protein